MAVSIGYIQHDADDESGQSVWVVWMKYIRFLQGFYSFSTNAMMQEVRSHGWRKIESRQDQRSRATQEQLPRRKKGFIVSYGTLFTPI